MVLVGLFVGRERGHAFYGLLAMTLFGVSTVYQQAVYWFSASFSILALDTFLLALLAAQHAIQIRRRWPLALSFLGCALAPAWFASGILAGPLCTLYFFLALSERNMLLEPRDSSRKPSRLIGWEHLWSLVPFLGSLAFLGVSLPLTANTIMHLHHYGDKTAVEAFTPSVGILYACRAVVDHLAWGVIGVSELLCPMPWVYSHGRMDLVRAPKDIDHPRDRTHRHELRAGLQCANAVGLRRTGRMEPLSSAPAIRLGVSDRRRAAASSQPFHRGG
jgi:hypothetical protein